MSECRRMSDQWRATSLAPSIWAHASQGRGDQPGWVSLIATRIFDMHKDRVQVLSDRVSAVWRTVCGKEEPGRHDRIAISLGI